jgi:hypothetical protein
MRKNLLALAVLAAASPAFAEVGRADALKGIVGGFADANPAADPSYMDLIGDTLPEALSKCRYDAAETKSIERLVALFDKYITMDKQDKSGLRAAIRKEFPDMSFGDFVSLSAGIAAAPDVTKGALVSTSCPLLLQMHYRNGASKRDLADAIERERVRLESAPRP